MRTTLYIFGWLAVCNISLAQSGKLIASAPNEPKGFSKTKSGLEYKIFHKGTVKGVHPRITDIVEMNINVHMGDSEVFNSRRLNNNEPVSFPITKPTFHGDPVEGFMLMEAGDSAVFFISVDSMKQPMPGAIPGKKMEYNVSLISVKSAETVKAEKLRKYNAQLIVDTQKLADHFAKNKIKATKAPSGIYYTISKQGTGASAKAGQKVSVNYTGRTMNGKVFDSNIDSNYHHVTPFSFEVGKHQVITGWDKGILLIKKGGKGTLYIPSPMAYGEQSPSSDIPPNSILIFDIEVLDIK